MFGEGSIIDRKCENSRSGNKIENMLWAFKGGEPWPWRPEAVPAGGKPSQSWEAKPELDLKNHFGCRPKTKLNSLVVAPCCGGKNTIWDGSSTVDIPTDAPGCTVQPVPVLSKHLPERTHVPRPPSFCDPNKADWAFNTLWPPWSSCWYFVNGAIFVHTVPVYLSYGIHHARIR